MINWTNQKWRNNSKNETRERERNSETGLKESSIPIDLRMQNHKKVACIYTRG